uniref:Uncharacterized protein n=1 Tax=Triticum urartu TaxID=4572 RepID=A0A8R7V4U6_TRIUA
FVSTPSQGSVGPCALPRRHSLAGATATDVQCDALSWDIAVRLLCFVVAARAASYLDLDRIRQAHLTPTIVPYIPQLAASPCSRPHQVQQGVARTR